MTRRQFSDEEILDSSFPDPRMREADHRPLRHEWYRQRAAREKRSKAIELYSRGWFFLLWDLWTRERSIDATVYTEDL